MTYKVIALSLWLVSILGLNAQNMEQTNYQPEESNFANPERGLYHHTEVHSNTYNFLNESTLRGYRENESITQILRVFYLEKFVKSPISEEYLNNMRRDFEMVRQAGVKAIIRFAYTTSMSSPYGDATPEIVQMHISQLKPVLRENADVIAVMQTGFVGAWGEWYYTDHFAGYTPSDIKDSHWEARKNVVLSLLDALPSDRMIQIRTPGYKMKMFESDPLSEETAFTGSDLSRIGHHNDCFVASSSDYGTYVNQEVEKPFLEQETRFTAMGGETCNLSPPYSDCDNSLSELQRFHWSYLNIDYNKTVLNEWENQGCFDEIVLNLGYRHQLISSEYETQSKPGGVFHLTIDMINNGYANFYNPRDLQVVLRHNTTGTEYKHTVETNTRMWPINEAHQIVVEAGLPEGVEDGDYSVFLSLPDPYHALTSQPAYAVRLANEGVWNAELGYNDLGYDLQVSANASTPDYMGSRLFEMAGITESLDLEGDDILKTGMGSTGVVLYWPIQTNDYQRIIERSEDGVNYEQIAGINAGTSSFTDVKVTASQTYHYRYFLLQGKEKTPYSEAASVTFQPTATTIVIDGDFEDWNPVAPLSSALGTQFQIAKCQFGLKHGYVMLENLSEYEIYINADDDETTGLQSPETPNSGADYLISEAGFSYYQDGNWQAGTSPEVMTTNNQVEFSFALADVPLAENNNPLTIAIQSGETWLTDGDRTAVKYFRAMPPDLPAAISIAKDEVAQNTLMLTWEECFNCSGYIVERSESEDGDFEEIKNLDSDEMELRDFELPEGVTQYYRLASYNTLGMSEYSEVLSETPGSVITSIDGQINVGLHPNPTLDALYFEKTLDEVWIISMDGATQFKATNTDKISLKHLKSGVYLIKGKSKEGTFQKKVIKQ